MERPRMRPLFKLELPVPAPRLMAAIREKMGGSSPIVGVVMRKHVELTIGVDARHLWSPHLSLDVFDTGETTTLRGRYAPHPSIWTFVMAVYGALTCLALCALVYGLSQLNLGWNPWALWLLPVCVVGAAFTWMTSVVGQRLAEPQMELLHDFLHDCVRRASDPPARRDQGRDSTNSPIRR